MYQLRKLKSFFQFCLFWVQSQLFVVEDLVQVQLVVSADPLSEVYRSLLGFLLVLLLIPFLWHIPVPPMDPAKE